jgi:thymidylate synthase
MEYTHRDGTPFTKEEFLEKLRTDKEFNDEFGSKGIDQIQNLINDLKTNPDSRRLMVNAWNVGELDQMVLPPCHYSWQVYTRELSDKERIESAFKSIESTDGNSAALLWELSCQGKKESEIIEALNNSPRNIPTRAISLMWNQRSVDTFLGLPFNIASYGLLLEIIAKEVNMIPDELIGNLGDVHLYSNHIEQAKEQIGRTPYELPKLSYLDEYHYLTDKKLVGDIPFSKKIEEFRPDFFKVVDYQSHSTIKAPLSN